MKSPFRGWVIAEWFAITVVVLLAVWAVGGIIILGFIWSSSHEGGFGLSFHDRIFTTIGANLPLLVAIGYLAVLAVTKLPSFLRSNPPIRRGQP